VNTKLQRRLNTAQIAVFIIVIFIPLLALLFETPKDSSDIEQRPLKHDITFQLQDPRLLLNDFETFFSDQLAYRDVLVRGNGLISVRLFQESPVSQVVIGKNGWLFYAPGLDDFRGLRKFSDTQLEQWRIALETKRDWLASYGVDYLFVVAPDKQTIYPEYVPDKYTRVTKDNLLDQLINYLSKTSDIKILDLRPALLAQKSSQLLYYPDDTHWNDLGAYIAYSAVLEHLQNTFPSLQALPQSSFATGVYAASRDLERIMGFDGHFNGEQAPLLRPKNPCASWEDIGAFKQLPYVYDASRSTCAGGKINAVFIHDSFFLAPKPMFAESFHQAAFVFSFFYPNIVMQLVESLRPNVLIEELVQRNLDPTLAPSPYSEMSNLLEFQTFKSLTKSVLPDHILTDLFHYQIVNEAVHLEGTGISLNALNNDPQLVFSVPEIPANSTIVVHLDLELPEDTVFQVFYGCLGSPFSEQQSGYLLLRRGPNDVYLKLHNTCPVSQLRVDPGRVAGKYFIHNLEVRTGS